MTKFCGLAGAVAYLPFCQKKIKNRRVSGKGEGGEREREREREREKEGESGGSGYPVRRPWNSSSVIMRGLLGLASWYVFCKTVFQVSILF